MTMIERFGLALPLAGLLAACGSGAGGNAAMNNAAQSPPANVSAVAEETNAAAAGAGEADPEPAVEPTSSANAAAPADPPERPRAATKAPAENRAATRERNTARVAPLPPKQEAVDPHAGHNMSNMNHH
jgi:hypothetical protein